MNKKVVMIVVRFAFVLALFSAGASLVIEQITIHRPYSSEALTRSMGLWYILDFVIFCLAIGLLVNTLWILSRPPYNTNDESVSH